MGKLDITISTQEPKYKKQDTFFVFESSSKEISLIIIFLEGGLNPHGYEHTYRSLTYQLIYV